MAYPETRYVKLRCQGLLLEAVRKGLPSFNPYQRHLIVVYLLNYRYIEHECKNSLKNNVQLAIIPTEHEFDSFKRGNKIFKTPQVFIWAVRLNMHWPLGTELRLSRENVGV